MRLIKRCQLIILTCVYCFFNSANLTSKATKERRVVTKQTSMTSGVDKIGVRMQSHKTAQEKDTTTDQEKINNIVCVNGEQPVYKKILKNGLTILVRVVRTIPQVSLQIWYKVGSKDEKSGERGIAHLIEHMIFKGTEGKESLALSESDINILVHKLSGSCNAFTSYDYTGYLFNFPSHHWKEALPVMADCMQHAAFKNEHLNSEMKAVIQELKLRRDDYGSTLLEDMLASIFADHPYHYPIIGYKQDLWSVKGKDLHEFHRKHYLPNNATLVVVGDVDPEEVFKEAEKYFGDIKPNPDYQREQLYHTPDIVSKSITLYRDVQQPFAALIYEVPGVVEANGTYQFKIISWLLGRGKGSRLHKKLVDELKLVTSFEASYYNLFDRGLFIFLFEPKKTEDIEKINAIIQEEIASIVKNGLSERELQRAQKNEQMSFYNLLEHAESQAYEIGKYYTALGNEQYVFTLFDKPIDLLSREIIDLFKLYFRPAVAHKGIILPLPPGEKEEWLKLQQQSDLMDNTILSARVRSSSVEPPRYANKVEVKEPGSFDFPKPLKSKLSNGVRVLSACHTLTPKIELVIELKAGWYYDSVSKPGLYNFLTKVMMEGTEKFNAAELADELESRGMSLTVYPGGVMMSMLNSDLEKGLEILEEMLSRPRFDKVEIEKVREQQLADIKNFWDEPRYFANQLIKERIYKRHPYSKNILGTEESVKSITRDDLIAFHKKYITPQGARLAIVGDIQGQDIKAILEKQFAKWQGPEVPDIEFPPLREIKPHDSNYYINRDQVVLCFAGISIARKNKDFDQLLLFDQIFGGGVLGSLHSRLFQLREETGLFYGISGTMLAQSSEQPGLVLIKTLVSLDRLDEAEKAIRNVIATVTKSLTEDELDDAKRAIANSLVKNFETNMRIAQSFIFVDRYDFPDDFFDKRAQELSKVTLDEVKKAVNNYLQNDKLLLLRVGRVDDVSK